MSVIQVAGDGAPAALTLDTPATLATETTAGVYQLIIDTNNMSAGDVLVVRSRIKVVSGGTSRLFEEEVIAGITPTKAWSTEPVAIAWEIIYELEQTDGSAGRVIPFSVLRS